MLKQAIDAFAATLNREWAHDRTKSVGASEIGQCARKVFWDKNVSTGKGVKADADWEDQYGARVRGVIMEQAFWTPAMQARFGENLLYAGDEQRTLKSGYLSATPDALIINQTRDALKDIGVNDIGSDCFMAESKTIDPRTNLVEAKIENLFQTHVQLGMTRELTPYKPVYNVLTYTDASFWSEVMEFPVEFDPGIYQAAKDRATVIMTANDAAEIQPEGWIAGGKECAFCPYVKPCGVERRAVPQQNAKATPQFVAEITDYALEANRITARVHADETNLRALQQTIKDRLREKGVRRIKGVVNWFEVAGAVRYGATKMKEHLLASGEDIEEFATISEPSDRLVISAIPTDLGATIRVMPKTLKKTKAKTKPKASKAKTKKTAKKAAKTKVKSKTGRK